MVFAGNKDQFAEHRAELERIGWTVQLIDGSGHELGGRPDVIVPILRRFLDPILLPKCDDERGVLPSRFVPIPLRQLGGYDVMREHPREKTQNSPPLRMACRAGADLDVRV